MFSTKQRKPLKVRDGKVKLDVSKPLDPSRFRRLPIAEAIQWIKDNAPDHHIYIIEGTEYRRESS